MDVNPDDLLMLIVCNLVSVDETASANIRILGRTSFSRDTYPREQTCRPFETASAQLRI
jgi:hypothetical protein